MTRKNGFLDIEEYQIIRKCNRNIEGLHCKEWIEIAGEEYLFKIYESKQTCYTEMFWSFVLTALKIPNVGYDLAYKQDEFGVITKNALPEQGKMISITELIKNTNKKNIWNDLNIIDLNKIFYDTFQHKLSPEKLASLKEELYLQFIIQILSGHCDLSGRNFSLLETDNITFFPYYDFGKYNEINLNNIFHRNMGYNEFVLKYISGALLEPPKLTLEKFFLYATPNEVDKLKEYIEKFQTIQTNLIWNQMEEIIHDNIPNRTKKSLSRKLVQNAIYLEKKMK